MMNKKFVYLCCILLTVSLKAAVTPTDLFDVVGKKNIDNLKKVINQAKKEGVDVKKFINITNQNSQYMKGVPDFSLLHLATYYNWPEGMQYLIDNGADVNLQKTNTGDAPLHLALSVEATKILLNNGADINKQNNDGNTPLHSFCLGAALFSFNRDRYDSFLKLITYLLCAGANRFIQNNDDQTPRDMAVEYGDYKIANLFVPTFDFFQQCSM